MPQVQQIDSLAFAFSRADSGRVCYIIMPEGVKEEILTFIDESACRFNCNIVLISGINWNDDLTPWPAEGVFKQKKPFGGKASSFLNALVTNYIEEIECTIGIGTPKPERFLVGISLSGLFVIWALTQTGIFSGAASISGSFWYDGLVDYLRANPVQNTSARIHISLGDREKNTRDERMREVETNTEEIVAILSAQNLSVDYHLVPGTHFSPILPRLTQALESLLI